MTSKPRITFTSLPAILMIICIAASITLSAGASEAILDAESIPNNLKAAALIFIGGACTVSVVFIVFKTALRQGWLIEESN